MKLLLAIVLVIAAFVGGLFLGPVVLPRAEEKAGIAPRRPFDPYARSSEAMTDLAIALMGKDRVGAYKLLGPSYRGRVSEAQFVAACEKFEAKKGAIADMGPKVSYDNETHELRFSLVVKPAEGANVLLPVAGRLERDGDAMRFESCDFPPLE